MLDLFSVFSEDPFITFGVDAPESITEYLLIYSACNFCVTIDHQKFNSQHSGQYPIKFSL